MPLYTMQVNGYHIHLVFGEFLQCLDNSKACEKVAWRVFQG